MADNTTQTPEVSDAGTQDTSTQPKTNSKQTQQAPAAAPVVMVTKPTPVATPKQTAPVVTPFSDFVANLTTTGTTSQKYVIGIINSYISDMAPGIKMTQVDGAKHQEYLWNLIKNVVNLDPEEFKKAWTVLLAFFNNYADGVFNDRYVFRFFEVVNLDPASIAGFQNILNLIKLTAEPSTRAASLKQVDLEKTTNKGFTEKAKQNIMSFYS
jgi:hypothetical protein